MQLDPKLEAEMIRRGAIVPPMRVPLPDDRAPFADDERQSKRRNKYTTVDGILFRSKKEAKRYSELVLLKAAGQIKWFVMQVPFRLPGGTKYFADFVIVWTDGNITVEDVKGQRDTLYKTKKREVEHQYGFEIQEI